MTAENIEKVVSEHLLQMCDGTIANENITYSCDINLNEFIHNCITTTYLMFNILTSTFSVITSGNIHNHIAAIIRDTSSGAATSYNSRGGLSFAHLFSGSTPAHAMIIHKTASFIIHHISHFSMFPMALGTM